MSLIDIKDSFFLVSSLSSCLTVNAWVVGLAFYLAPGKVLSNFSRQLLSRHTVVTPIAVLWLYGLAVCLVKLLYNFFCNYTEAVVSYSIVG